MYINPTELTLSEEQIYHFAEMICLAGFGPHDLSFQSRANRDAVYREAKQRGASLKKSSTANQTIDPRYTVEGSHLPDKGLANDSIYCHLYHLERVA